MDGWMEVDYGHDVVKYEFELIIVFICIRGDGEKSFIEVTTFQSCWFLFGFKFDVLIFLSGGAQVHRFGVSLCGGSVSCHGGDFVNLEEHSKSVAGGRLDGWRDH